MDREELAPHVRELTRVLEGKLNEDEILKELDTYLNHYRVSLEAAKRGIVRKHGGDPNALARGTKKPIQQLGTSEQSVDLLVRVITANRREIDIEGHSKAILYGIFGDESGTVPYTAWDAQRFDLKKGEVYLIRNAYTKEWNGQPQVNLGNRATIELQEQSDLAVPEGANGTYSFGPATEVKIAQLRENMTNIIVVGRILFVEKREVEAPSGKKDVFSGTIADETGKAQFSAWHDFELKENDVVRIENAYVKSWRGVPQLTFGERATVSKQKGKFPSAKELSKASRRLIQEIESVGGGIDVTVVGTIVDIKKGTGLIFRCPECNRVVQKGACRIHGQVNQQPDLRIKAVIDDGTAALTVVMNKEVTEQLTGISLKAGLAEARDTMNPDIVGHRIEERLLTKPVEVRGNVTSDEYGLMMIASEAHLIAPEIKADAEALLNKLEASA